MFNEDGASSSELPAAGVIRNTIGAVDVERSSLGLSDAARSSCTSEALRFRRNFVCILTSVALQGGTAASQLSG